MNIIDGYELSPCRFCGDGICRSVHTCKRYKAFKNRVLQRIAKEKDSMNNIDNVSKKIKKNRKKV